MADTYTYEQRGGVVVDAPRRLLRTNDAEYEHAHGMEPLEDVHAERDSITDDYVELRPRYGPMQLWKVDRDALEGTIALEVRAKWETDERTKGIKLTEGAVAAVVANDERIKEYMATVREESARYERLVLRMGNLEERSQRGQVIGRLRASEAHMTPAGL